MLGNIKNMLRSARGFTVTELTIVIVVLGVLMVPLSVLTLDYFGSIMARSTEAQLATESQTLLRTVVEELRTASSVKVGNTISDPNEPPSGWSTSNDNLILIISTPALNSARAFIYDPLTGMPYQNELIYFVEGQHLYRRTLANTEAVGNTASQTCPSATATTTCPADKVLTEHFVAMNFILYDQDDIITTNISLARSLVVNISMEKPTFGSPVRFDNTMRMTMRNTL